MNLICCLTSGVLMGMLFAGCSSLSTALQSTATAPSQPRHLRPAPAVVRDRMTRTAPDLYFDPNSQVPRARERRKLDHIAPALQDILHDFPDVIIVIEGHSDDHVVIEYNDHLALMRAEAVRRVLLNLSFPEDRLRTVSFAYRESSCPPEDGPCRQKNRRVHFRAALAMPEVRVEK
ncbi:MAG: OmpA family protein [Bryobacterales bacterium]|nr:OmpA family protein [Bryobacterales bacterium]